MKSLIVLCVLALVVLSQAGVPAPALHPRGCIYINGRCYRECEEGTHAYTTGCGRKTPEPTCDQPDPVEEEGVICDYSACYCDSPTVRDTVANKCVPKEQCPKTESNTTSKESVHNA